MGGEAEYGGRRRLDRWRVAGWGTAAALLLLPLVAMQFTQAVNWTAGDFLLAAILLGGVGGLFELAVRRSGSKAYRAAVALALAAALLLVWITLAVGIIGSEEEPANLMYAGVLGVGLLGSLMARFRPRGMARALVATALAQALVAMVALTAGWGPAVPLTLAFLAPWLASAWLFRQAAREQAPTGERP